MLNNEYYLWGAGTYGARIIEFMKKDLTFKAVIDNDPKKQGTVFHGLPVISYDEAKRNLPEIKVVAAKAYPMSICDFLLAEGYTENRDFFSSNDFLPRYYWEKNRSLVFRTICFAATTICNKKCDGCMVFVPMAANPKHISAESIMRDLDLLFSHVDSVTSLNFTVGESLLNKDLPDICSRIYEKYSERYGELTIQTNSTIIPEDDAMRRFSESKTIFVPSNYPENVNRTERFIEKCKEFNVSWYFNPNGGDRENWLDFGSPRDINEKETTKLCERFKNCFKPGMGLHDGRLYMCFLQTWSHLVAEIGTPEPGDAFDLNQPKTEASREELYRIISRYPPERGYLSHCMRCNGTSKLLKE